MRSCLVLIGAAGFAAATMSVNAGCDSDNCLRDIGGTRAGTATLAARLADCSSYFLTTVIPAPVTVPSTTTVTAPDVVFTPNASSGSAKRAKRNIPELPNAALAARQAAVTIIPTSIPSYATKACDGNTTPVSVRYTSACSCLGVLPTATTFPASTVTSVVSTVTTTVSLASTFYIAATGTAGPLGYLQQYYPGGPDEAILIFTSDISQADPLTLSTDSQSLNALAIVNSAGLISEQDTHFLDEPVFFESIQEITYNGYVTLQFTVHPDLSISAFNNFDGYSTLQACMWLPDIYPLSIFLTSAGYVTGSGRETGQLCSPTNFTYVDIP